MKENLYKFVFDKGSSKKALVALVFLSDLIEFKIALFRSYLIKEKTKTTKFLKNLSFSGNSV